MKGQNKNQALHAISLIVLSVFIFSENGNAGPARTQVVNICRQTPTLNQATLKSARGSECGAAKDQLNAKNSNTAGSVVWAAVTVICTSACAQGSSGETCSYSNQAATRLQEALSKNFAAAVTPIENSGLMKKKTTAAIANEKSSNSKGGDACMSAAKSGLSSFQKAGNAGKSGKEIVSLYKESKKLDGTEGNGQKNAPTLAGDTTGEKSELKNTIPGENLICREENLKTAVGALACAAKTDPNLPPSVRNGEFLKELEKVTGKPADQFFSDFKDPASAISAALAGTLDASQSQKMGAILAALDQSTGASHMKDEPAIAIASASGGKASDADPELDINGLMKKLLGENEEEKTEEGSASASQEGFKAVERKLASVTAENSSVSIFDRVKWRYLVLDQKQNLGGLIGTQ